jgi:hypothetical protein
MTQRRSFHPISLLVSLTINNPRKRREIFQIELLLEARKLLNKLDLKIMFDIIIQFTRPHPPSSPVGPSAAFTKLRSNIFMAENGDWREVKVIHSWAHNLKIVKALMVQ